MTIRSRRYCCVLGVDQCPRNPDLNATLANQISIYRGPQTVMGGFVPAIHVPDAAPFAAKEGVDHRVEPGDDNFKGGGQRCHNAFC